MDHLEEALDALAAAKNIGHDNKREAEVISSLLDTLEELISETWKRFRTEAK